VGWRWWAVATLLPASLVAVGVALNYLLGAPPPRPDQVATWPMALLFFLLWFVLPIAAPLGEEPGWRGLAQPLLLHSRSALLASLILGLVWALWHLPLIVVWKLADWSLIPLAVPSAILMTWIALHTRGSVLLAVAYHSSFDAATNFVRDLATAWNPTVSTLVLSVPLWLAALVLVAFTGKDFRSATRHFRDKMG
jgi:membrane protease YdiL (CAAX protease family)